MVSKMGQYYYDYSTSTLQENAIEKLENLNKNIENTNILLCVIAFAIILQLITSFVRNIF